MCATVVCACAPFRHGVPIHMHCCPQVPYAEERIIEKIIEVPRVCLSDGGTKDKKGDWRTLKHIARTHHTPQKSVQTPTSPQPPT